MVEVIRRPDGSTMTKFSREELREILKERRVEMGKPFPPGIRAAERGR